MTREILTNQPVQIQEVGIWFVITGKNNINGSITFKDNFGHLRAFPLHRFDRSEFNIPEMRKGRCLKFDPFFVEFNTDADIETITIDVEPANPDKKLIS